MKQKIINKFPFDLLLENGSVQTRQNVSSSSLEEETVFFGFFADLFFTCLAARRITSADIFPLRFTLEILHNPSETQS